MKTRQVIGLIILVGMFGYAMSFATFNRANVTFSYAEVSIPVNYPSFFGFIFGLVAAIFLLNLIFRTADKRSRQKK